MPNQLQIRLRSFLFPFWAFFCYVTLRIPLMSVQTVSSTVVLKAIHVPYKVLPFSVLFQLFEVQQKESLNKVVFLRAIVRLFIKEGACQNQQSSGGVSSSNAQEYVNFESKSKISEGLNSYLFSRNSWSSGSFY